MAGEWRETTLGEHVDLSTGEAFPSVRFGRTPDSGTLLARGDNIKEGEFEWGEKARYWPALTSDLERHLLKEDDILLGMDGSKVGKNWVRVRNKDLPCLLVQRVARIRARSTLDQGFLRFIIGNPRFRDYVGRVRTGTSIPHISGRQIRSYEILLPPLSEQRAIAEVLGALDDKIELNRRMNATLEAMARALFQSWFVDFDPVRAKLDGHSPTTLDSATAAFFPASFQDSRFGPIAQGWKFTTLGEACDAGGGSIQTGPFGTQLHASDYVSDGVPSIMPSDLRDNRIDPSSISRIREEDAARLSVYRVQAGDVVYSRRGDVERRSLIRTAESGWLCGTGCLRVRFGPRGLNPHFGASWLGTLESRAWVVRHAVGATMPNLNTSILGALPVIVPPLELQSRFAEIVGPWDERGTIALEQSRTLATLRNTLLPRLLSGELSVGDSNDTSQMDRSKRNVAIA